MIFSALVLASTSALADEPTGDWLVEDGAAQIRIENCNGALWGFVAWEKTPGGRDGENPDPAKRERPTLGMPILLNMQPSANNPGRYDGEVYNAQNGKTYTSHISLTEPNTLRIEGCVLGFLCGGQNWTRATPPEPAAGQTAGAMAPKGGAKTATTGATAPKPPAAPPAMAPKPPAAAAAPAMAPKTAAAPAKPAAPAAGQKGATRTAAAGKPDPSSLCSTLTELPGPAH